MESSITNSINSKSVLTSEDANRMAWIFKSLSDPTRLRLLSILFEREVCVNGLAESINVSQSAVSHQLRLLRNLRFVSTRRVGQQVFYRIDDIHIQDLFVKALEHTHHIEQPED